MLRTFAPLAIVVLVAGLARPGFAATAPAAPVDGYRVLETWRHDPTAFTEGLAFANGLLYESTGENGSSTMRIVALRSGRVLRSVSLPKRYWAEGATVWNGRVYQLTLEGTGFVYDAKTLKQLATFRYSGQPWGLTHDATSLIVSDGSDVLRFLDPTTFAMRRQITVEDAGTPVSELNELEYVNGAICANVFPSPRIACIDEHTGRVLYWINLTGILPPALQPGDEEAVLNGIAYGGNPGRLLVTGKEWPRLFEIQVVGSS